jgi:hypothetical protein
MQIIGDGNVLGAARTNAMPRSVSPTKRANSEQICADGGANGSSDLTLGVTRWDTRQRTAGKRT